MENYHGEEEKATEKKRSENSAARMPQSSNIQIVK